MIKWYDKEEDILNIELTSGDYWKSIELPNGVVIDIDKKGKIKGFEILNASKIFSGDMKKVIDLA
jgi:uncharacterized protein YuzE